MASVPGTGLGAEGLRVRKTRSPSPGCFSARQEPQAGLGARLWALVEPPEARIATPDTWNEVTGAKGAATGMCAPHLGGEGDASDPADFRVCFQGRDSSGPGVQRPCPQGA